MKKRTVTICSSASFYREVLDIETRLKKLGLRVLIPTTANVMRKNNDFNVDHYKTWFKNKNDYKKKTKLMKDHFKKVIKADAILVVNNTKKGIRGYIGANVLMEMVLAFHYKKKMYILNSIEKDFWFIEEILGMNPIFLNGDLLKVV